PAAVAGAGPRGGGENGGGAPRPGPPPPPRGPRGRGARGGGRAGGGRPGGAGPPRHGYGEGGKHRHDGCSAKQWTDHDGLLVKPTVRGTIARERRGPGSECWARWYRCLRAVLSLPAAQAFCCRVDRPYRVKRRAAWRPAAAAARKYARSSDRPRPMLDSRTGLVASASIRPSGSTVTRVCRSPSGAAWAATRAPNSPSSPGTTTSARVSATRP